MPVTNDEENKLLKSQQSSQQKLLKLGVKKQQIAIMETGKLTKLLQLAHKLEDIFKIITIEQILGINHTPPPIKLGALLRRSPISLINHRTQADNIDNQPIEAGDFSVEQSTNMIKITYKKGTPKQSCYKVGVGYVSINNIDAFDKSIKNLPAIQMVNSWYQTNSSEKNNQQMNYFYCPSRQEFMAEIYDLGFPIQKFKHEFPELLTPPFYREQLFIRKLEEISLSIEKLKSIKGMTIKKIETLSQNTSAFNSLLAKGLTLSDIGAIEENRLAYTLTNFNIVESAMELVTVREVMGLNQVTVSDFSLFKPAKDSLIINPQQQHSFRSAL